MEKYLVLHRLSYEKTLFSFCLSHTIVPKYLEPSEEDEVQAILYEGVTAKEIHQNPADSGIPFDVSSFSLSSSEGNAFQSYLDFHVHDHYQITLCTRGHLDYIINNETIRVQENDILCINQSTPHTWYAQPQTECLHLGYYPNSLSLNSFCARFASYNDLLYSQYHPYLLIRPDNPHHKIIRQILYEISDLYQQRLAGYDALIHNRIVDISIYLTFSCSGIAPALHSNLHGMDAVQKAVQFINENFQDTINVNSVSQYVGMNNDYFSHCFKSQMGLSCKKYINLKRVEYASSLLTDPNYNIAQIAFDSGFSSLSTFYKCFMDNYHLSPSQYRQIITNKTSVSQISPVKAAEDGSFDGN
ncbi:helix-turn-helix domain-containing protein [Diplocloster modestus]|uniref:Helix-turn-helix domain-containing protein n=1 Tax=Diplocloster modestus TaxID=2850322 RepID=A0ABS6K8H6_9FIRM|nr:helix-turn-helix domain-containing protein [Diplocloster modestus]MBU9726816.1 helix-turn-helix domain-containing protein [Diplocloster modestus]